MLFKDIIGQTSIGADLRQMALSERLPHALLLLGPAGSGKRTLALALTQFLLCDNRTAADACGHCAACNKVEKLIHPDVHFVFPVTGANMTSDKFLPQWRQSLLENPYIGLFDWLQAIGAENKQGNINKEECQQIVRKLSLKTFEAKHKVLFLWLPEFLGNEGNRLLKIIEEPPAETYFILMAENQEQILNTILSRCQLIKTLPLSDAEVAQGIQKSHPELSDQAWGAAYLANGDMSEALKIAANKENNDAALFLDWLRKCYKGNGIEMVKWVDQFASVGREGQKHFLQYGLHFMREFLLIKLTGASKVRLQPEELKTAQNLVKVLQPNQVERIAQLFNDCYTYIERNANPNILFLDASIQLHKTMQRWDA